MSRTQAALDAAPQPVTFKRVNHEPMVYRGEMTGTIYLQYPEYPYTSIEIGKSLRDAEQLRDKLTAFLDGAWREL